MATPLRRMDARSRAEAVVGPNMTPMVDVILVILIFFMATTVIVGEEWFLGAGLSREARADAGAEAGVETRVDPFEMPPPRFTLRLRAGETGTVVQGLGQAVVVGSPAAMDAWAQASLGGLDASSLVVLIAPAPDVRYEDVVAVHDALVRAQVEHIALAPVDGSSRGSGP
jgi:biopolymer transport protein ExbD